MPFVEYNARRVLCVYGRCLQIGTRKCQTCGHIICSTHLDADHCVVCNRGYPRARPNPVMETPQEVIDVDFAE